METAKLSATLEAKRPTSETIDNQRLVFDLGRIALRADMLGINDPLTHLYQYLSVGESALVGIREDLETDIAERLPKTPFINHVGFEFTGHDFVSVKDAVSMKSMTANNLAKFELITAANPTMAEELSRAEIEAQEVVKLADWIRRAPVGGHIIFESLPIGQQQIAISRIYQKTSDRQLLGSYVSLYNPNVDQFNRLRKKMSPGIANADNASDILQNCYEFYESDLTAPDKFIDYYVDSYDQLLEQQTDQAHAFGLSDIDVDQQNGLTKVRNQPGLTAIYVDTVKSLATSRGVVTPELIQIAERLGFSRHLTVNQALSTEEVQDLMREVILSIVSVVDKADAELLSDLSQADSGQGANYAAMSYFGGQAKSAGQAYASNNCPEYGLSNSASAANNSNTDFKAMQRAFNVPQTLDDFGEPSIGVCRISNCPTRGDSVWWPDKTLVGGCAICVDCHHLFGKGKSPDNIYRQRKNEQDKAALAAERQRPVIDEAGDKPRRSLWWFLFDDGDRHKNS